MRIALLAAIIALVPVASFGQNPAGVDLAATAKDSAAAAQQSLSTLSALAANDNAERLGFAAPGDAAKSELGQPWSDFIVRLDDLRSWKSGSDAMSLLRPTGLVVYPVTVGGGVRSSVTLKKEDSEWKAVSFGAPGQTQAVANTRDSVVKKDTVSGPQTFQVRIAAFNLLFVGYVSDGKLMLTPVADSQRYDLSAGVTVEADKLFTRLQPDAERDPGLPR